MARIPQYVSKENPTTEAPAIMQREESFTGVTDPSAINMKGGEEAGRQLQEVGLLVKNIENANSMAKAELETKTALVAYEESFKANPDKDAAFKTVDKDMQTIGEIGAKNFKYPGAKQEFLNKWGMESLVFKNGLQTMKYKEEVDKGRANVIASMDLILSDYVSSDDAETRINSRNEAQKVMDQAKLAKLFGYEEGDKEFERLIKQADTAREDNKALVKRREKETAMLQKQAVSDREKEFVKMKISGVDRNNVPITTEELMKIARSDVEAGVIRPDFGDTYIKSLKSPKSVGAKSIDPQFSQVLMAIRVDADADKIRNDIEAMRSDGKLSQEDYVRATTYLEQITEADPDDLIARKKQDGIKGLLGWSENNMSGSENKALEAESRARMNRLYLDKLSEGKSPELASLETTREEVLHIVPDARYATNGMLVRDKHGVYKTIMPNGDVTVATTKGK